ncbi:hypothetical protein [Streptosporangium sp. NPDC001681]|uniref:hypothetical protein n=1 Tax=Streptosporangium sp. NPDC001681 TaxID=3154395 RepID=UPI00332146AB
MPGVAVFGPLFAWATQHYAPGGGDPGEGTLADVNLSGMSASAKDAYLHAVAHGTQRIFLVCAFAAAVFIKEVPLRGKPGTAPAKPAASAAK